jgi:hypothetical protein
MTAVWGMFRNRLWLPRKGEWDLHASSFFGRYPNFLRWSKAPYWHNAHHIIPDGVLNGCISEVAKSAESNRLYILIRSGLLDAKYNLNHKDNVVILPMGKEVAKALGLPRHISGIEAEPGVTRQDRSHTVYSANVEKEVKKVISKYAEQIDEGVHDEEADQLSKIELEVISENLYIRLREWGKKSSGESLDSIPADLFKGLF